MNSVRIQMEPFELLYKRGSMGSYRGYALSPDGLTLATINETPNEQGSPYDLPHYNDQVALWDVPRRALRAWLSDRPGERGSRRVVGLGFIPAGDTVVILVAVRDPNGDFGFPYSCLESVCFWDSTTGALQKRVPLDIAEHYEAALSPDGSSFAVSAGGGIKGFPYSSGGIKVFAAATGELVRVLGVEALAPGQAFSRDGTKLAALNLYANESASLATAILIYPTSDEGPVYHLPSRFGRVESCAFSPDSRRVLLRAEWSKKIEIHELASREVKLLTVPEQPRVSQAGFSLDSKEIVLEHDTGTFTAVPLDSIRDPDWQIRQEVAAAMEKVAPEHRHGVARLREALQDSLDRDRHVYPSVLATGDVEGFLAGSHEGYYPWMLGLHRKGSRCLAFSNLREVEDDASVTGFLDDLGPEARAAAIPALLPFLKDPVGKYRYEAARVLGEIGPAALSATAGLTDALRDEEDVVRACAAWALGQIGARAAAAAL
jgi:hypothetical protein